MTEQEWLNNEELPTTIWKNKYQNNNETFEEWLVRVSGGNEAVARLIREKKFIFGGRILSNRGIKNRKITLSNCYVITPPEDSLESIFEVGAKLARTFSYGGGCGLDISNLRPKDSPVNNAAKSTSGPISFMDFYSYVTGLIGQAGRRGATMISISCTHPDLVEFINLKSNLDVCTKANISVRVNDAFMKAVESNSDFTLEFTFEDGTKIEKVINAKEVFMLLAKRNWEMAEPGILYWDRISNYNLLQNTGFNYAGVNPCVTGDTLVLTQNGYIPIKDLIDSKCVVWNGYEWSEVQPKLMQRNAKVYAVSFSDGSMIRCTDYHKFPINTGDYRKVVDTRKELKDIKVGDKLIKCSFPVIEGPEMHSQTEAMMYTQGFYSGDGFDEIGRNASYTGFYGEKKQCAQYCSLINQREDSEDRTAPKDFVPSIQYTVSQRLAWLAGLVDSDGSINSKDGSLSISSINKEFLLQTKLMLNTLGCTGSVSQMHQKGVRPLPSSQKGERKEYLCQESFRLTINASNVEILMRLGLQTHRVPLIAKPNRNASRFIKVTSIEYCGEEDVYCFNEPKNHTFIANGCLTGNCAEEPLPAGGSCLLGSLNLAEFVINPFTNLSHIDYEGLIDAVAHAVQALNVVLLDGLKLHPLQEQRESVYDWRQIGLGTMGLGDMLIKMGIKYGSPASITLIESVYKTIAQAAIETSLQLAKLEGCFPRCTEEMKHAIVESDFVKNLDLPTAVLSEIREYGLFNSQLLTCAPTGTIGTMLQVSTGVEPNFAFSYNRRTVSLNNEETVYSVDARIVQLYRQVHGNGQLPNYFVAAQDIPILDRIKVQSTLQKYIDASISSTINLPNSATVEDVADIYMEAWKQGLKGVTIWRDGCERQAILSTKEPKKEAANSKSDNSPRSAAMNSIVPISRKAIGVTTGSTFCKKCACGTLYITVNRDNDGNIVEVFTHTSKGGICAANTNGLTRMVSLALRSGVKVEEISDQLKGITCPACLKLKAQGKAIDGISCPDILSKTITEFEGMIPKQTSVPTTTEIKPSESGVVRCPECGEPIQMIEGCMTCPSCGYSRCS